MSFSEAEPGFFIVRYDTPEEMAPDQQQPLEDALRRRVAQKLKVGIIFLVGPAVKSVRVEVPAFWLRVTRALPLTAMAIVTRAMTVKVATLGFDMANKARGVTIAVQPFEEEAEARAWMKGHLHG
jgi:hypothetical protein